MIDLKHFWTHWKQQKLGTASVRCDIEGLFNKTIGSQFNDEVIGLYAAENLPAPRNITYLTRKMYYYLKISTPNTYSCEPERACHTILKTNSPINQGKRLIAAFTSV